MTLHVVQVPDPAPGADWSTVVPGIYTYDVTGITAELVTGIGAPGVARDASPNHDDGIYHPPGITFQVPGLVGGDTCITANKGLAVYAVTNVPTAGWVTTADIWMNFWGNLHAGNTLRYVLDFPAVTEELRFEVIESVVPGTWTLAYGWGFASPSDFTFVHLPLAAGRHMFSVRMQRGSGGGADARFYVDGAPHAALQHLTLDGPTEEPTVGQFCPSPVGADTYDEVAYGTGLPSDAAFANLYAQASVSFAAYTAAQLALGNTCEGYYHLDEGPGTGREPSLVVTDGTTDVLAIPPGFPAVLTPGPYLYAWQPNLNADSQSSDGTLTTVAIPRLLAPAGYTIGTRTPDIQPGDQWTNVAVWWDDTAELSTVKLAPYAYPPGHKLVYRQLASTP